MQSKLSFNSDMRLSDDFFSFRNVTSLKAPYPGGLNFVDPRTIGRKDTFNKNQLVQDASLCGIDFPFDSTIVKDAGTFVVAPYGVNSNYLDGNLTFAAAKTLYDEIKNARGYAFAILRVNFRPEYEKDQVVHHLFFADNVFLDPVSCSASTSMLDSTFNKVMLEGLYDKSKAGEQFKKQLDTLAKTSRENDYPIGIGYMDIKEDEGFSVGIINQLMQRHKLAIRPVIFDPLAKRLKYNSSLGDYTVLEFEELIGFNKEFHKV